MSRTLRAVMTDEAAELEIFSRANEKGKFAVPVAAQLPSEIQDALERGFDNDWFRLVDVTPITHAPGLMRIFRLTDAGRVRLATLSPNTDSKETNDG